jgi:hypothetical protein
MHVPIGRCEQAAKASRRDRGGCPSCHLCKGLAPGRNGVHANKSAEQEVMAPTPHGGHTAKHESNKARQIGEGDHQE